MPVLYFICVYSQVCEFINEISESVDWKESVCEFEGLKTSYNALRKFRDNPG